MRGSGLDATLRRARVDGWTPLDLDDVVRRARRYERRRRGAAICAVVVPFLAAAVTLSAVVPPAREVGVAAQAPAGTPHQPAPPVPAPAATTPPTPAPQRLLLEAEDGGLTPPMAVADDPGAGERFVGVEESTGPSSTDPNPGAVDLEVRLPAAGRYHLWARVNGPHTGSNSFLVSVDGGPELAWHFPDVEGRRTTAGWEWVQVPGPDGSPAHDLDAGLHRLRFHNREDGAQLDRVLLTSDLEEHPGSRAPS